MAGNYLAQLFGMAPTVNPSEIPAVKTYSPALERRARANGFPNADAMMNWSRQRNTPTGGTIGQGAPSKHTLSQGLDAASMIHPKNILSYILSSWQGAMPKD